MQGFFGGDMTPKKVSQQQSSFVFFQMRKVFEMTEQTRKSRTNNMFSWKFRVMQPEACWSDAIKHKAIDQLMQLRV